MQSRPQRPGVHLLGVILLLPFLLAWAGSWEGIREASRRIASLDAQFVQKKTLPILAKPFVSHGRFLFQTPARSGGSMTVPSGAFC